MTRKQRLVIIGNGMAGARLVEEVLARQGSELFEIIMFGDEPYGNYNRILLSGVLAGTHDPQDIFINRLTWYEENKITLHAGKRVSAIDPVARVVRAGDDLEEPYDKLVIATGSSPFVPALENLIDAKGKFKDGAFVFRTIDDCQGMIEYATNARKAVVIGGGLLGLEAARGLLNRGLEVHVAHVTNHPMNVQLDPTAGKILKRSLENMGVNLHLKKRATSALGNGHITGLAFQDGSSLDCDMVIISTGIRPNVELAQQAGLTVEQGIVVNDDLSCKDTPDIYALGKSRKGSVRSKVEFLYIEGIKGHHIRVVACSLRGLRSTIPRLSKGVFQLNRSLGHFALGCPFFNRGHLRRNVNDQPVDPILSHRVWIND